MNASTGLLHERKVSNDFNSPPFVLSSRRMTGGFFSGIDCYFRPKVKQDSEELPASAHSNGFKSANIVGSNSDTVGWICMARWISV